MGSTPKVGAMDGRAFVPVNPMLTGIILSKECNELLEMTDTTEEQKIRTILDLWPWLHSSPQFHSAEER
jgi:hypothetical protein